MCIKARVLLVPELIAPGIVECVDIAVTIGKPPLERGVGDRRLIELQTVFVVDLPAHHRRVIPEPIGQRRDNPRRRLSHGRRQGVVVPAAPMPLHAG
jgi:hypothetical protein